jgi:hypothetical protein
MSRKNKKAAGGNQTAFKTKHPTDTAINTNAQRQRLLAALRKGNISTLDARRELDILHPAARVQELREAGHHIITYWHDDATELGQVHRVANYVLLREASV